MMRAKITPAVASVVAAVLIAAVEAPAAREAAAQDWPQWRGPNRDDISTETGLLRSWPERGLKLLWTAKGIGVGYSTVSISDALIYTAGHVGDDAMVMALDLNGNIKWQAKTGPAPPREAARSTPTVDGGRVYYENPSGDVVSLDAKTGQEIWSLNILQEFGGRNITWWLSESLLIDGDNLICCPGAPEAGIVALSKTTGQTVWICEEARDKPAYASPIIVEHEGLRQIVTMTAEAAVGVNAKTGELLWRIEHKTQHDANIPTPIYDDGYVFICSGYSRGGQLLKLSVNGNAASADVVPARWRMANHHGGVILLDGYLYGYGSRGWSCLDFQTGKATYTERGLGKGSLTCADGMLYILNEQGEVGLVEATPQGHEVISRFNIPEGGEGPTWAHPVVCGGRLYVRHGDYLYAFDIKEKD